MMRALWHRVNFRLCLLSSVRMLAIWGETRYAFLMLISLFAALCAAAVGFVLSRRLARARVAVSIPEVDPAKILSEAKKNADDQRRRGETEAKLVREETRQGFLESLDKMRESLDELSQRLDRKQEQLKTKDDELNEKRKALELREAEVRVRKEKLLPAPKLREEQQEKLHQKLVERAGVDEAEMVASLIDNKIQEANLAATQKKLTVEEDAKVDAERRAKRIIGLSNERFNMSHQPEKEHPGFRLADPELVEKGGGDAAFKEAFTSATQAELNVSDDGRSLEIRSVDPLKREIGRRTLVYMKTQGVVHTDRIGTVLSRVQKEVDKELDRAAERAVKLLRIKPLEGEVKRLFSRLLYRASYSQNQWHHAVEVAYVCGLMAAEMGLDVRTARRAGLLHDIGKAMTHDHEGSHALLGADVARTQGESEDVANAIGAHHGEEPANSPYAEITAAGDAISGARPGARREIQEAFSSKVDDLYRIATGIEGVERVHIMQGGREVRVFVGERELRANPLPTTGWDAIYGKPGGPQGGGRKFLTDAEMLPIARQIAEQVEEELTYPGQIRITVIRETRAIGVAR